MGRFNRGAQEHEVEVLVAVLAMDNHAVFDRHATSRYSKLSFRAGRSHMWAAATLIWLLLVLGLSIATSQSWFGEGRDYQNYLNFYSHVDARLDFKGERYEPGFVFLSWFARHVVGLSFQAFLLIVVFASLIIKVHLFRKYTASPLLAFVAYLFLFFPAQEYAQIRAALALSLAYWALCCGSHGRWAGGALLLCAAVMFHYTALIVGMFFVGLYFVRSRHKLSIVAMIVISGAVIVSSGLLQLDRLLLLNPLVSFYLEGAEDMEAPTLLSVLHLTLAFGLLARFVCVGNALSRGDLVFISMTVFGLVLVILLSSIPVLAQRLKDLLVLSVVFWAFNSRINLREAWPSVIVLIGGVGVLLSMIRQGIIFG